MKVKEEEEKLKLILLKNKAEKEKKDKKKEKDKIFSPKISKKNIFNDDIKNKGINLENNSVIIKPKQSHRGSIRIKRENINDNKEYNKNIELNEKEKEKEREKEKEIFNKNLKKEEIKLKYFKYPNVYRCLKCNFIF